MVPIAYDDSVTVKAPARSALGHVTPEEFEQLSTNGAVESWQAEAEGGAVLDASPERG